MLERFVGENGPRRILDALTRQSLTGGDAGVASELHQVGTIALYKQGDVLIQDGGTDNEIHLIIAGSVDVYVNQRLVARRHAGQHVGEMALINPAARRSAAVVATDLVVTIAVPEPAFTAVASRTPELWRRIALELSERLRQRNLLVTPPNPQPCLFIGCSVESLPVARAIQLGLQHDKVTTKLWTDGVFHASSYTLEALDAELKKADFGVLVLAPEDKLFTARAEEYKVARDNVVLELGMCLGMLGRRRTYFTVPRVGDIHLPTDLLGVTPITYSLTTGGDIDAALAPVCEQIRRKTKELGVK